MPPDGFSFEEAMKPVQSAGFSFEDALKPAPGAAAQQPPSVNSEGTPVNTPTWGIPSFLTKDQSAPPIELASPESVEANNMTVGTHLQLPPSDNTPVTLSNGQLVKPLPYENEIRNFLKPADDTASVLPVAGTIDNGTLRPAVPRFLGELGTGILDLMHGPETGTVTPEATSALTAAIGSGGLGLKSVAADTGAAIADKAAAADAVAAIGRAPDIDTAIQAAGKAAEAPARPMAEWMQPVSRHAADLEQQLDPLSTGGPDLVPAAEPESVGAAASRDMTNPGAADISISDMKANRRTAEMDQLLQPPQPNDANIYVPNSFPTKAEYSADPEVSQYENLLRQRNPSEFIGEGKRLTENNKARVEAYDALTVPDTTLNTMRADRQARWIAASDDILPTAKPVDLEPVHAWVDEQLSNPRIQENDAVRSVLENFQARLIDSNGDLKTDPAAAWGIHDNIQNQLAKAKDPLNMTGAEKFAEGQLITAKNLIDQALDVATDNKFRSALAQYAEDSKAINAGVLLNDFRPRLTNMSGDLQAANFHRFVVNLAKERGDPGIDPAMDISDDAMRSLINIDLDLKRAGLIKLGGAAGSPTNLLGALATSAGLNAAHSFVSDLPGVGKVMAAVPKAIDQYKLTRDTARHLAAPEGGYVYPNGGAP